MSGDPLSQDAPTTTHTGMETFTEGDRVRHKFVDLAGTVARTQNGGWVKVKWDHSGLAYSALGSMADLQRAEMLERPGRA